MRDPVGTTSTTRGRDPMTTRTIAIAALVIAVVILLFLLL